MKEKRSSAITSTSNVVAIVFSDLHLNIWSRFNENNNRTLNQFEVLRFIKKLSNKYGVPTLFCGDFFHKANNVDTDLAKYLIDYEKYLPSKVFAIAGNHDIPYTSTVGNTWSLLDVLHHYSPERFKLLDAGICYNLTKDIVIYGIPYIDHNIGLNAYLKDLKIDTNKKNILLLHTDYPGAKDPDGRVVGSVENLNTNTLSKFNLVLCGHIHKPQRLSKNVYMVGAPNQQSRTDINCKMGIWLLHDNLKLTFLPLDRFPKFIDVESEDQIKDDGNYYTVIPTLASKTYNVEHNITKRLTESKLARRYMRKKGISDHSKCKLLINLLKRSKSC